VPIIVPPFVAYQQQLYPLPAKWNTPPPEGDMFIPVEIDWGLTTPVPTDAVQISLTGGPIPFSQIVALSVDNGRSGGSVSFLFPDTGKQLTLPPFAQGIYPIMTNSLSFYVVPDGCTTGDVTVFEILNSLPPPVSVFPAQLQSHASITGMNLSANGTTVVIAAPTSGTVQGFSLTVSGSSTTAGACDFQLADGTGTAIYHQTITVPAGYVSQTTPMSGLLMRFTDGLDAVIATTNGITAGNVAINVYYSVP
jgi:hypothetical protein